MILFERTIRFHCSVKLTVRPGPLEILALPQYSLRFHVELESHRLILSYYPALENCTVLDPCRPLILQDVSIVGILSSQASRIVESWHEYCTNHNRQCITELI